MTMPRRHPFSSTPHAGRRGKIRVSSFQALMLLCCGAALMVVLMWHTEEKRLPHPKPRDGLRGGGGGGGGAGGGTKEGGGQSSPIDVVFFEGESVKGGKAPIREANPALSGGEKKSSLTDSEAHNQQQQHPPPRAGQPPPRDGSDSATVGSDTDNNDKDDDEHGDNVEPKRGDGVGGWVGGEGGGRGGVGGGSGNAGSGGAGMALAGMAGVPRDASGDGNGDSGDGQHDSDILARSDDTDDESATDDSADAKAGEYSRDGGKLGGGREGGGQKGDGEEGKEEGAELERLRRRRRLNGLVEASVARAGEQECNMAFVKTHKTASTTLTAVLYRYGVRHGRRVARFDVEGTAVTLQHSVEQTKERGKRVDIFHYHHVWNGFFESRWDEAQARFGDIMAEPESIKYVTVLRDPVEHWLSYYYFFFQPETKLGVTEFITSGRFKKRPLKNPLAAEFGIYNDQDLDDFVSRHLPTFTLVMLTDEIDEGLVLLGKILGWDPIDLTYASLLENRDGLLRWDDLPVSRAPKPEDLDNDILEELERLTYLDSKLYSAAKDGYAKVRSMYEAGLEESVHEFRELQAEVVSFLEEEPRDSPARAWYVPESDYYFYSADSKDWWKEDYPPPLPF